MTIVVTASDICCPIQASLSCGHTVPPSLAARGLRVSWFREGIRLTNLGGGGPNSAEVPPSEEVVLIFNLLNFLHNQICFNSRQVLEDGTLVLRRLDSGGAGRYACRVETGVRKNASCERFSPVYQIGAVQSRQAEVVVEVAQQQPRITHRPTTTRSGLY